MSFRLGLISDIHADPAPLREALSIFTQQAVDQVVCLGDIGGYGEEIEATLELLEQYHCQSIQGNHEAWYLEQAPASEDDVPGRYYQSLPVIMDLSIEGKTLYMVHASPPDSLMDGIRLLDQNGNVDPAQKEAWTAYLNDLERDVLIVGHTHQVFAEQLGNTLVINPGSTTYNHSCAILDLPELKVNFIPLSNKPIAKTWNWGDQVRN
jgi:putative phosphoesterase